MMGGYALDARSGKMSGTDSRAVRTWPLAGALFVVLALPAMRHVLERVMIIHMLVQIPLLAVAGGLVVLGVPESAKARLAAWNGRGVPGILLALMASSWWMLPRALDAALAEPSMEAAKFISLPLLVGAPIALSWHHLPGIGRGFVIANVLPMWAVVGWLYVAAPTRVCNFYLIDQQVTAGFGLLGASVALALASGLLAFRSVAAPQC
jgi:hypothetical protein